MPLITPIAGAYTGTWNAGALGLTEEGFKLTQDIKEEAIDKTDQYARTTLDTIGQGVDWFAEWKFMEYGAAGLAGSISPHGSLGQLGIIGRSAITSFVQSLVLTSTAGTPAAAAPASLTASKSKMAAGQTASIAFDSSLRKVPCRMQLLPYVLTGSTVGHFTTT